MDGRKTALDEALLGEADQKHSGSVGPRVEKAPSVTPRARELVVHGRTIPVILPNRRDPRLKLSIVILTLQVLGQTVLDFKLSIAQILVSMGVCALIELFVTLWRDGMLVWPASGLLTGNSVAFILRASGTRHGDWWSLDGIEFFVFASIIALLSKYLIRPGDRHLFNPSNVGLVLCLLLMGPSRVFPQYLWWGPIRSASVVAALVVILVGALWVLKPVRMFGMAASFLATFAAVVGLAAVGGRTFEAVWHSGPIGGLTYWRMICLSPELLIFVFFMMSDPQTAPKTPTARVVYGVTGALVAGSLVFFQATEFGVKLGILSSLTVACALVPAIEVAIARLRSPQAGSPVATRTTAFPATEGASVARRRPIVAGAVVVVALVAPIGTAALASNREVLRIERGQTARQQ